MVETTCGNFFAQYPNYFRIFVNSFLDFLQDSALSWYTRNPDLTQCFQKTVLVWIPCWFLCLMIPLHIYLLRRSNSHNHKWTWNSLTKMVANSSAAYYFRACFGYWLAVLQIVAVILVVVSMTDLTTELYKYSQGSAGSPVIPHVDMIAPLMKLISFVRCPSLFTFTKCPYRRQLRTIFCIPDF